ncbi:unnamed protein product [Fusarium graminearum]|nr:unnamed protein product [Fusarium graminearum]CAG1965011.1 unnamed protein product [Fusarium graminearum]
MALGGVESPLFTWVPTPDSPRLSSPQRHQKDNRVSRCFELLKLPNGVSTPRQSVSTSTPARKYGMEPRDGVGCKCRGGTVKDGKNEGLSDLGFTFVQHVDYPM